MADENPPIKGADASKFAEGAERVNRASKTVEGAAGKTAKLADDAGTRINRTLSRLEGSLAEPGAEAQRQARVQETMRSRRESVRTAPERAATRGSGANVEELRRLRGVADQAAASEARLSQQMRGTAISADLAGDGLRRNGALTTQFIQSAAKGQVTMRELGNTVATTIGKFGAWTAAATAVYGIAAAMAQLGKGASDSVGGVHRISRVVTDINEPGNRDRAQEGFRDLSKEFNVPISDAVEATYGSGKIFGDLASSIDGARSSLFAMKVGELDAATATESLNAIVRGFGLEARQLPGVFDAINSVTNKFGGNVGKLTQGVGRAGGLFASAGGTPEQLIALLSAGSQETGAPATEVATAIGRSVSTVRTKAGAARARAAGLDPTLDPYALIQQAQQLAKGQSAERVQEIVRSIIPAGGQFSRIMTPLILDADRLNKTLAQTAPEKAKGSAQRELAKVMKEPVEQIAMLGNGLQRLGSSAGQAGLLTPFVLILKTLNTAINLVDDLFGLFHKVVPNFMEPILASAIQLYAVIRLMRKFDVGGQLKGGKGSEGIRNFIGATPDQREHKRVLRGLDVHDEGLASARASNATAAASAAQKEAHLNRRVQTSNAAGDPIEEQQRHERNLYAAEQRRKDLIEGDKDFERDMDESAKRRQTYLAGRRDGLSPQEALRGKPHVTLDDAQRAAGRAPASPLPTGVGQAAAAEQTKAARAMSRLSGGTTKLAASASGFGVAARGVVGGSKALVSTAGAAASAAASAGKGLRSAGAGLAAMLGPLDLALIGLFVGIEAIHTIQEHFERNRARIEKATQATPDLEKFQAHLDTLDGRIKQPGGKKKGPLGEAPSRDIENFESKQKEAGQAIFDQLAYQQSKGRSLDAVSVATDIDDDLKTAPDRKTKRGLVKDAIAKLNASYQVQYEGGSEAAKAAQAKSLELVSMLADLGASGKDIANALSKLDEAGLASFVEKQSAAAELHGPRGRRKAFQGLGQTSVAAANLYAENGDIVAYLKSLQGQEEATVSTAESRLKSALDAARSPAARHRARSAYSRELTTGFGINDGPDGPVLQQQIDTLDVNKKRGEAKIKKWQAERAAAKAKHKGPDDPFGSGSLGGLPGADDSAEIKELDAKIKGMKGRIGANRTERAALKDALARRKRLAADQKREQANAEKDEREALVDARTSLGAGRQSAGAPRLAYEIRRAGAVVRARIKRYGRNSVQALNAIQQEEDLQSQAVQYAGETITSKSEYAAAGAGTEEGAAKLRAGGLQDFAKFQQAHPKQYSANDVRGTLTQLREANQQRLEQEKQDAIDLIAAKYEYLSSLTDNPVELAKLAAKQAQQVVDKGGFKNQAEKYRALANRNTTKREKEKAVSDRKIENIEYDHDIGKLTDDAEIRALERVMRTMKVGSEARRDLRMRIGRLKHQADEEGQFNVNVGDIKLPTIYEIRRAVAGSKSGQTTIVQHNTLNATGTDPAAVVAQFDTQINRGGKAAARAAGVR